MVKSLKSLIYLLLLLLLLVLAVMVWLRQGEREIAWARPWLISALNPENAPYAVDVGRTTIDWQDLSDFGRLRVEKMTVSEKGGEVFAELPEVHVTLDPLGFLPHRRGLHGIAIDNPRLYLVRDEAGVVRLGLDGAANAMAVKDLLASFAAGADENDERGMTLPFRQFAVNDAHLAFNDAPTNTQIVGEPFDFRIERARGKMEGELSLPFKYKDQEVQLDASLITRGEDRDRLINFDLRSFPSELVCMMIDCGEGIAAEGLVNGEVTATLDRREKFKEAYIGLNTDKLTFTAPDAFEKPVKLRDSSIILTVSDNGNKYELVGTKLGLAKDTNIVAKGIAIKRKDGWYVNGEGSNDRLNMGKLHLYWPKPMAPDTRAWVLSKLKDGYSESATIKVDLTPEDMSGDVFRDEAIDSTVNARQIDFEYLPGFPHMQNMNGNVRFTGKTITIESENSGEMLTGTKVQKARLDCPDVDDPYVRMTSDLTLTAPAADVATLLKLPHFTFDDTFNLDPAAITGETSAVMKLGFDGFSPDAPKDPNYVNFNKVVYDIDAKLTNIAQPKMFNDRDIAGLSGSLKANNQGTYFDGSVKLEGGTDLALVLNDADGPGNTIVSAKGTLAKAQFASFGIPEREEFGEGSMGIDVEVGLREKGYDLKRANIDFTNLALDIHDISWSKEKGKAASLKLTPGKAPRSYDISFSGADLTVSDASLVMNEAMDDVETIKLGRVKNADNDFSLTYQTTLEGYNVNLTGTKLDASVQFARPGSDLLADFPPINLNVDLGELALVKTQPLRNVKGRLHCNKMRCESANLTAQTGVSSIIGTIVREGNQRRLSITASDAGDFLRGLDITDRVYGGKLSLRGPYDDAKAPPKLLGRLIIEKFKLKNSQILARILSIGSLSGLANVLTGAGIDFEKLGANMSAQGGVIRVSEGRAEGAALGITVEGKVDTTKSGLNIKGVVVPANMLNSIFGKIPIIGELAGGEGEGIIAFNYSVKGTYADPEVFVNPLSGLTPGFLRGIWGGGSTEDIPEQKKEGEEGATSPSPAHGASSPPTASQSLVPDRNSKASRSRH